MIFLIIFLSIFFRFFKFTSFQYFGGDEELLVATIRHMVWDKSPSLLVQNAALEFGLGPYYHYFLAPFFAVFRFDLISLQAIASVLGVVTTIFVYLGARELGGKKLGKIAAFLYSCSFFISAFDRRLYHLTLNPLLSALTFFCLAKLINKKHRFFPLLAIPFGFAMHEDASLAVLALGIFFSLVVFKIMPGKKQLIFFFLILVFFSLPFFAAEIKYNHAFSKGIIKFFGQPKEIPASDYQIFTPLRVLDIFGRILYIPPSKFLEEHFFYKESFVLQSRIPMRFVIFVVIAIGFSLLKYWKGKRQQMLRLSFVLLVSFVICLYAYTLIFHRNFYQHYFMIIYPVFIIFVAQIMLLIHEKFPKLAYLILGVYFVFNLHSLLNSEVKYTLVGKIDLIKKTGKVIGDKPFTIEASYSDNINSGGWTELYTLYFRPAVSSYHYKNWDWIYKSYSLYPKGTFAKKPQVIVRFYEKQEEKKFATNNNLIKRFVLDDIRADVF